MYIRNLFDGVCAAFIECATILPIDTPLLSSLTDIPAEIITYLTTSSGARLPFGGHKISFSRAIECLMEAVNTLIEAFRCFICALQAASIEHIMLIDTLLPLDLVLLIAKQGYIIYDDHRILLGSVRVRGVPKKYPEIINIIYSHEIYKCLDSCLHLGDFYEQIDSLFTVGSVHLKEFTLEAAKKFIIDVWDKSSLR
ncbi:hypothetical protein D5b_00168 [Faustovirus]|nr:hypothetical protein D5b_00168 [Faustovirus]AMN84744.1 hypothetical protein D6_00343 [Faustovirus]AMP44124.1 hypothetical protein PRJ_Dakar_00166 [Faustovirus]